jgi:hypothetical protein
LHWHGSAAQVISDVRIGKENPPAAAADAQMLDLPSGDYPAKREFSNSNSCRRFFNVEVVKFCCRCVDHLFLLFFSLAQNAKTAIKRSELPFLEADFFNSGRRTLASFGALINFCCCHIALDGRAIVIYPLQTPKLFT